MATAATVVSSAARTATGNSGAIGTSAPQIALLVNVTAASGTTPTLNLTVEWSHDGTTFAAADGTADSFAQITAAKVTCKSFTAKAPFYRLVWTIAGTTPSFTFSAHEYAS